MEPLLHLLLHFWTTFWATFWAMGRALPGMLEQASGRIINISSIERKLGKPECRPTRPPNTR
ncbi:MAG: hypothetical protein AAF513_06910 [Pseudomonadota bacterium]